MSEPGNQTDTVLPCFLVARDGSMSWLHAVGLSPIPKTPVRIPISGVRTADVKRFPNQSTAYIMILTSLISDIELVLRFLSS